MDPTTADVSHALRLLRRYHTGTLRFAGVVEPVRFVLHASRGMPLMPVPTLALSSDDVTLHIPDDSDDLLILAGMFEPVDPDRDPACDRWLASFDHPDTTRWGVLRPESARRAGLVFEGEQLVLPNPLGSAEGAIAREFAPRGAELGAACERLAGVRVPNARIVGVDPFGIDIRARFGPVRLEFDDLCASADEARLAIERLLRRGAP